MLQRNQNYKRRFRVYNKPQNIYEDKDIFMDPDGNIRKFNLGDGGLCGVDPNSITVEYESPYAIDDTPIYEGDSIVGMFNGEETTFLMIRSGDYWALENEEWRLSIEDDLFDHMFEYKHNPDDFMESARLISKRRTG